MKKKSATRPPRPQKSSNVRKTTSPTPAGVKKSAAAVQSFPIVGIGASAGGLEALEDFFAEIPNDSGIAFVVVTHQHPGHKSLLPELLGRIAHVSVVAAVDGMKVEPNHVYVSQPGGQIAIINGRLHRMEGDKMISPHLPIDYFLRSLAEDQNERAICIILSGTGTDGTLGLKAVKGAAGLAMVQHVTDAKYAGMPGSAIATGLADYVLPAAEMPARLVAYVRGPFLTAAGNGRANDEFRESMQKIFVILRTRTGGDFSSYKPSTIRRRIERRMNLHQIKSSGQYVRYLQESPHEIDILLKELLINVTNFFRDPEAWDALAKSSLPALFESRPENYTFRIWVPGCATGEEVYSLAMLMRESLDAAKRGCDVQIFGTDMDCGVIETARNGRYPEGISSDVSARRLDRFFVHEGNAYLIRKDVREMAVFAVQNLINDPPFTKLDIISCRNLLIYLNSDLQRRLLPIFHYTLKPGGLLFLGSSETIGGFDDLFEVVDKRWKIFRRKDTVPATHPLLGFPTRPMSANVETRPPVAARPARESNIAKIVEQLLLGRFAPATVVVSERGDVIYIHGRTGHYLEPAAGCPRHNILDMAREGLQLELASAMRQASAHEAEVVREGVRVRTNGDFTMVNVGVVKLREPESVRGLLLVTFRPQPAPVKTAKSRAGAAGKENPGRIASLERDLQTTRESLQTTIEELETANEEFKSSNEELQSTNEELQSTNEEMETSKEEMQSLNEELTTVNAEMLSKVEEMSRANDDMQNLLNSTDVATIFLDSALKIKRYTVQALKLVNLIQSDIGRPLVDLVSKLSYGDLVPDCQEVLRTLVCKVAEVRTTDGYWYLLRIFPYRTAQNVIDGVVITFVDINPLKTAEKALLRLSKAFSEGPEPMMLLDLTGLIIALNDEAERGYGWSRQEMLNRPFGMLFAKSAQKTAETALGKCLAGGIVRELEFSSVTKAGREVPGRITLKLLTDDGGQPDSICTLIKHTP